MATCGKETTVWMNIFWHPELPPLHHIRALLKGHFNRRTLNIALVFDMWLAGAWGRGECTTLPSSMQQLRIDTKRLAETETKSAVFGANTFGHLQRYCRGTRQQRKLHTQPHTTLRFRQSDISLWGSHCSMFPLGQRHFELLYTGPMISIVGDGALQAAREAGAPTG